jgi:dTDP-4-dehydrorhamnose 3,5-epimerase-like enzyme
MIIETKDSKGNVNGSLIPLWHVDSGIKVDQVYLTVISPRMSKGPHLHKRRRGLFVCIAGSVDVVMRDGDQSFGARTYSTVTLTPGDAPLEIPAGTAAAIYNTGGTEALVLNMPSPPWRADEPDDYEVTDWPSEIDVMTVLIRTTCAA